MRGRVGPPVRHGQLQGERLVEPQPVPALVDDRFIRRLMHCSECRLQVHHARPLARAHSGSGSSIPASESSARAAQSAMVQVRNLPVTG